MLVTVLPALLAFTTLFYIYWLPKTAITGERRVWHKEFMGPWRAIALVKPSKYEIVTTHPDWTVDPTELDRDGNLAVRSTG